MKEVNLVSIVGIIGTFILVLLASFLFSVKSKNKISNPLFAVFLLLFALDISVFFTWLIFDNNPSIINNLRFLSPSFQMPVFYLYFLSVCYSDFKLKKRHLWHLLPYLLLNIIFIPRFYFGDETSRLFVTQNFKESFEFISSHIVTHIQIFIYAIICFKVLKRAKNIFTENYSGNTIKTYKWLFQLLISYCILYGAALIKNILKFTNYKSSFEVSQIVIAFTVLIVICWYVLKALKHPDLFKGVDSNIVLAKDIVKSNNNNSNKESIDTLKEFMDTKEPYLNPSLTIKNLAQQLNMPMRDLSVLINQDLNQHFFDFVNEYRIKKAMRILGDTTKYHLTVLEILYEVGFNSKSSFNTAFKKHTGTTPTQFRKNTKN